jgi:hypothetical protein
MRHIHDIYIRYRTVQLICRDVMKHFPRIFISKHVREHHGGHLYGVCLFHWQR